jgi:hypothetical protein
MILSCVCTDIFQNRRKNKWRWAWWTGSAAGARHWDKEGHQVPRKPSLSIPPTMDRWAKPCHQAALEGTGGTYLPILAVLPTELWLKPIDRDRVTSPQSGPEKPMSLGALNSIKKQETLCSSKIMWHWLCFLGAPEMGTSLPQVELYSEQLLAASPPYNRGRCYSFFSQLLLTWILLHCCAIPNF